MAKRTLTKAQEIERSINKTYRADIWNPFIKAIKQYQLIEKDDNIAVCISGGKDSFLMALLLKTLQKHSDFPFKLRFIVMNPGYAKADLDKVLENAKILDIPVEVFDTDIFKVANSMDSSPCYLCARMRRGYLYNHAKELGCNKIALGHHFTDVIETTVMGMFYGSQLQAMLPKLHSQNFEGMTLIRPLYCVHEDSIKKWVNFNGLDFINCACTVTKQNSCDINGSKRQEIKKLIRELRKDNPMLENSIFRSIHNAKVDTFVEYTLDGVDHSFLENYNKKQGSGNE